MQVANRLSQVIVINLGSGVKVVGYSDHRGRGFESCL